MIKINKDEFRLYMEKILDVLLELFYLLIIISYI